MASSYRDQSRIRKRLRSWLRRNLEPWREASFAGIDVHYKECLDGGGSSFGQDLIPFLRGRGMPRQRRVFEWCAGPGFIGFSMLGHGLCDTLCLADVNKKAVAACRRTIAANRLADRAVVYHSDNLNGFGPAEQFDLVVGNPPHYDSDDVDWLRSADNGWRLHREFFATIGRHLRPGGVIVLQENNQGSTVDNFRALIEAAGLRISFVEGCAPELTPDHHFYYIGIVRQGDLAPGWADGGAVEPAAAQ